MVAEVLKTTDDSMSAFPRAWRQADAAPNTAQLAQEDVTKAAPTSKQLGAHPSQAIAAVRISRVGLYSGMSTKPRHVQAAGHAPQPGRRCGELPMCE